jgi:hypothetical protein
MKKIYSLLMVSAIALTANAQLVFNENFTGYTNGELDAQGGWISVPGTPDVQVASATPLIYPGYTSGTQYITVANADGKDPQKLFISSATIPTSSARFIFMSFVVRVTSAPQSPNNNTYSVSLQNTANTTNTNNTNFPARFYIEKDPNSTNVAFGIAVGNENPDYTDFNYAVNTTYLIVIRYDVIAGSNNDNAYLWVNPTSLSSEPTTASSNASHVSSSGEVAYGTSLNALKITQSSTTYSPVAAYDAFRVAHGATSLDAWNNLIVAGAPLPVRLTSFNAAEEGLSTKIIWNTAEENGITSYVVEKSTDGRTFTAIGTVKATNQKTYGFTDAQSTSENSYYRLKMVEMDGSYKLSYIVSLKSKVSLTITTSPNPVKNALMIQHPKVATDGHIQIVSANGQMLKDIRLAANAVISNVDMSGFTSGLYHIVFKSGSDVFSKTVIKQ